MEVMSKITGWSRLYVEYRPWSQQLQEAKLSPDWPFNIFKPWNAGTMIHGWLDNDPPRWEWPKVRIYNWRRDGI